MVDIQCLSSMNKLFLIAGVFFVSYIFYLVYGPSVPTVKQQIENSGMDFEYITEEGSCFTHRADPVGPNSHKYILSLHKPKKPTNNEEPVYFMVGYMMKEVRIRYKSNLLTTNTL